MNDLHHTSREKGPSFHCNGRNSQVKFVASLGSCSLLRVGLMALFITAGCHEEDSPDPKNLPPEKIESVPTVALTNLPRGALVIDETTDNMPVTISGEACDSINEITGVTINGTAVTLGGSDDCKTFSTELNSTWGMNIVDVVVENAAGDELPMVQSFIHSAEYFPAAGTSEKTKIAGAWRGHLGQNALDDRNRNDLNDIASVMERAMNNFNFDEKLPTIIYISGDGNGDGQVDLITNNCLLKDVTTHKTGIRVAKNGNFTVGSVAIDYLRVRNERLEFRLTASNISQKLIANAYVNLACVPPNELVSTTTGKIEVNSVEISGSVGIEEIAGGIANFTFDNTDARITGLRVTIDKPGVVDNLINLIASIFNNQIEDLFTGPLLDRVIKDELGSFINGITIKPTVNVPAPVSVQLNVDSDLDYARFVDGGLYNFGHIDVGLAARVVPSEFKKEAALLDHGSIIGASTLPSFSDSQALGLGMKDDFINQILWAVWAGGGFDLSGGNTGLITDLLGSSGLDASFLSVETGLPPVLMPGGEGSEVKIGAGDVLVRMKINPILLGRPASGNEVEVSFYASLMLTGTLDIDPEKREISFTLSTEPDVHVQLVDFARTDETIDLESKIGSFASSLIQRLVSDVLSAIELPSIPLSNLEGIPAETKWVLDKGRTDHAGGYFRIIGEIGVE